MLSQSKGMFSFAKENIPFDLPFRRCSHPPPLHRGLQDIYIVLQNPSVMVTNRKSVLQ